MTLLEAINLCLRGIGRAPVTSEDDPDLDAETARATIETVSSVTQSTGWYFNEEPNWKLAPDSEGNIYVPNNVVEVVTARCSRPAKIVVRGRRLYDLVSHSFDLSGLVAGDGFIDFDFIVRLDFEDLPAMASNAIAYTARRQFAIDLEGDSTKWQFNKFDEDAAWVALHTAERRNKKSNRLNNSEVANVLANIEGQNGGIGMYNPTAFPRKRQY